LLEWDSAVWRVLSPTTSRGWPGRGLYEIESRNPVGQKRNDGFSTDEKIERPSMISRAMTYSYRR